MDQIGRVLLLATPLLAFTGGMVAFAWWHVRASAIRQRTRQEQRDAARYLDIP